MDTQANNLDLQVVVVKEMASVLRETVKDRAVKMLRTVLEELGARGVWRLIITSHGSLPGHQSQYWMEPPVVSEMLTGMVQIVIRSSLTLDGTILGMLMLPKDADCNLFLRKVKLIIERFNIARWQGVVEREERESMLTVTRVDMAVPRSPRKAIEDDGDDEASSRQVIPRPTLIDGQTALALAQGKTVRLGSGRLYQSNSPRAARVSSTPLPRAPSARARVQPGIGAELARQGFTPWLGVSSAVPITHPPVKEGTTMDQATEMSQAVTISGTEGYPPETVRRAKAMLAFLLDQAALPPEVTYPFQVTGTAPSLDGIKEPFVRVTGEGGGGCLNVKLRSRGGRDGTLSLSLALPDGLDWEDSLAALTQTAASFNRGAGWQEPLDNLEPAPVDRLARSAVTGTDSPNGGAPPPTMSPTSKEGPMTTKPLEDEGKLARFLVAAVQLTEVKNGVVSTGMVTGLITEHFRPANPKTFAGPLFNKLMSLGHVLHTGYGQFQVTEAFIAAHQLGIKIKVLPEYHKGDAGAKKTGGRGNGAHHAPTLAELLQNRQAMEAMIRETALREHRTLQQRITDLQAQLEAAQAALSAFEGEHAVLLGAEVVPVHALAVTGAKADRPH